MRSAALLALVLGALGFLPLCGGPRYEAALLAGLLAPSWTALVTALSVSARVRKARLAPGTAICLDALRTALGHCVAIFLVATLHGLRAGFCEPGPGYLLLLLGPGVGILLGAMWGASVGVAFAGFQAERPLASRVVCCAAALAGPALTAAWGLVEFYCGPSVYAFDPFVGYFAGPLYDSIPFDSARLALFRLGSALTAIGWLLAATSVTFKYGAQSWPVASLSPGFRLSVAGVLFLLSCGHASLATRMGLATTNSSIERALPGRAFAGS